MLSRRGFLAMVPAGALFARDQRAREGNSRLAARPRKTTGSLGAGEHPLGLDRDRDGAVRVPSKYRPETPAPMAVLLHGAGGRARRVMSLLAMAESMGIIMLAPDSRGGTWDAIEGDYGRDVDFVNRSLEYAFANLNVDAARLAIGGFSDGASYALSLGLDNGDLFSHVLAFSPGFIASRKPQGRPRIFVSHGTEDEILPIASTSRRLVPALDRAGYAVKYREFAGPHTVPPAIAHEGFTWFMQTPRSPLA